MDRLYSNALLQRPVRALLDDGLRSHWQVFAFINMVPESTRLVDVLNNTIDAIPHRYDLPFLQRAVRDYLDRHQAHLDAETERQRRWAELPSDPSLAQLAQSLHRVHDRFDSDVPIATPPGLPIELDANPPAVWIQTRTLEAPFLPPHALEASAKTSLSLVGFESNDPLPTCDCTSTPCLHRHGLITLVRDLVHGPTGPEQEKLRSILAVPSWQRMIDAVRQISDETPPPAMDHRLVWRIGNDGRRVRIEPYLQKQSKTGRWSKGTKVRLRDLPIYALYMDEQDTKVADLLHTEDAYMRERPLAEALVHLVDHPRVFDADDPTEPLEMYGGSIQARFQTEEDALRIGFAVDGHSIDPGAGLFVLDRRLLFARVGFTVWIGRGTLATLKMVMAIRTHDAAIPLAAHAALIHAVEILQTEMPVQLPTELTGETIAVPATPIVRLTPRDDDDGLDVQLIVRPLPRGSTHPPGAGPDQMLGTKDGQRITAQRRLTEEIAKAKAWVKDLGLSPHPGYAWSLTSLAEALAFLRQVQDRDEAIEWPETHKPWRIDVATAQDLRVQIQHGIDWFGVDGKLELDGYHLPLAAMLTAVNTGQPYIRVTPDRFVQLEAALMAQAERMNDSVFEDRRSLGAGLGILEPLTALEDAGAKVDTDQTWTDLIERMTEAYALKPRKPAALKAKLRDYQRDGFRWMAKMAAWGAGVCLADDMGLGKTIQTLAMLVVRKKLGPQLVIAPTSVGPNWMAELARFTPSLNPYLYRGPSRQNILHELGPGDIVVTSYDIAVLDKEVLEPITWTTLVLDEAQAIKNIRTQRAQAIGALSADWRLALTGTPIENHLGELWSLFHTIHPGLLGPWGHFKETFATPIERDNDPERKAALSRLLQPFILRRTKAQVAPELPSRTELTHTVELSLPERALYEAAREKALETLSNAASMTDRFQILAAMTRLRRLACHPQLVHPETMVSSSKLQAALEVIDQRLEAGERALVFSQFTGYLAFLRTALDEKKVRYLYLDGQTPAAQRAERVQVWQNEPVPLFVVSLKAGGTGLNLIGADCVLHLDPWWNPAVEDQATDRTHRIGQDRPVTVLRLVAQGTIEEAVLGLHARKRQLARDLLEGTDTAGQLSTQALMELIRFGASPPSEDYIE